MSFDCLAPHYRWMEWVLAGNKLQQCRTSFLRQHADVTNVLILGEGNGRFLVECRRFLRSAQIVCLDASERMLQLARKRLVRNGLETRDVEFITADALTWAAPKLHFDLVVTHFFLDCFRSEQLDQLLPRLAAAATPTASWLLADFQIPESGLARWRAAAIHRLMYWFFGLATQLPARRLTPPDPWLVAHGFRLRERRIADWGLLRSDLWERVRNAGCGARSV